MGDRTSIQCVVGTGDLPLVFTWLKDGQVIYSTAMSSSSMSGDVAINVGDSVNHYSRDGDGSNVGGTITIRQNDEFTSALSITSVTRAQSGTYVCRVQNDAAIITHSAELRVNGKYLFGVFFFIIFISMFF